MTRAVEYQPVKLDADKSSCGGRRLALRFCDCTKPHGIASVMCCACGGSGVVWSYSPEDGKAEP